MFWMRSWPFPLRRATFSQVSRGSGVRVHVRAIAGAGLSPLWLARWEPRLDLGPVDSPRGLDALPVGETVHLGDVGTVQVLDAHSLHDVSLTVLAHRTGAVRLKLTGSARLALGGSFEGEVPISVTGWFDWLEAERQGFDLRVLVPAAPTPLATGRVSRAA